VSARAPRHTPGEPSRSCRPRYRGPPSGVHLGWESRATQRRLGQAASASFAPGLVREMCASTNAGRGPVRARALPVANLETCGVNRNRWRVGSVRPSDRRRCARPLREGRHDRSGGMRSSPRGRVNCTEWSALARIEQAPAPHSAEEQGGPARSRRRSAGDLLGCSNWRQEVRDRHTDKPAFVLAGSSGPPGRGCVIHRGRATPPRNAGTLRARGRESEDANSADEPQQRG
jgi:hypothetical protein